MNKNQAILTSVQIVFALIGCYLIGDAKVIFGMILLMWANNFNYKRKAKIDASNTDIGKE